MKKTITFNTLSPFSTGDPTRISAHTWRHN